MVRDGWRHQNHPLKAIGRKICTHRSDSKYPNFFTDDDVFVTKMMHGWKYLFPECSILIRQFDEYDSPFSKPGYSVDYVDFL